MPKKKMVVSSAKSFGNRLAQLRRDAGYSQRELGELVGLSQRMVAYYEGQTDHPPTQLLPAFAEVLGVSADQLLGIKPLKASPKSANQRLWRRFKQIEKLPPRERKQLLAVIDTFLDRNRLARQA
ncbi:MAG: helix-turn-helix transcriptional regulator [Myxococcales bacterium]|nr:helix-turn-helix transcriptional regulator [Myxococcales bacterium]MCB9575631.1 helix-turn-helix transcriptional regulator [Polyangiaceae bacterium]